MREPLANLMMNIHQLGLFCLVFFRVQNKHQVLEIKKTFISKLSLFILAHHIEHFLNTHLFIRDPSGNVLIENIYKKGG